MNKICPPVAHNVCVKFKKIGHIVPITVLFKLCVTIVVSFLEVVVLIVFVYYFLYSLNVCLYVFFCWLLREINLFIHSFILIDSGVSVIVFFRPKSAEQNG